MLRFRLLHLLVPLSALLLLAATSFHYPDLPNPQLTSGIACPGVTVEMLSHPGFTAEVRKYGTPDGKKITGKIKHQVYLEYGITSHKSGEYEIDHLISLELGGSNDIKNLWPQPYHGPWNAHQKDRLENELHRRVIHGEMKLEDAQREIAENWIALYQQLFPGERDAVGPQNNGEPDDGNS